MKHFSLDPRDIGGRHGLDEKMSSEVWKMQKTSDVSKSRSPKLFSPKSLRRSVDLSEVRYTFNRIERIFMSRKHSVDDSLPESYHFREQLTRNRAQRRSQSISDHMVNVQHMQRRIKERIRTPACTSSNNKSIDNDLPESYQFRGQLRRNKARKRSQDLLDHEVNVYHMQRRIQDRIKSASKTSKSKSYVWETKRIKDELLNFIIKKRLYKKEDINDLFDKARSKKRKVPRKCVEKAIIAVRYQLDSNNTL